MSQSRVFNLVRDGVVVASVSLAADIVKLHPLFSNPNQCSIYLDSDDGKPIATLSLSSPVWLHEITQEPPHEQIIKIDEDGKVHGNISGLKREPPK